MDKEEVLTDMVDKGFNILDDKYSYDTDNNSGRKKVVEHFQDKYNYQDKDLMKSLKKNVEILLINKSSDSSETKKKVL